MTPATPSSTAVAMAFLRAHHARHADPKIFDDYLAASLIAPEECARFELRAIDALHRLRPDVDTFKLDSATLLRKALRARGAQAEIIARARFTEDRLLSALQDAVSQYVILGAGLDTFALRRADLRDRLTVFEIDLPAFQDSKRARLAAAGLACPPNLQFLAADFERESVADVLLRSAYRRDRRGFFSWLGVTFYLSSEAVFEVLRSIHRVATPGSLLAFDYIDLDGFDPPKASLQIREIMDTVRQAGEPMISGFDPRRLAVKLAQLGFRVVENIDPAQQQQRYFSGRTDGLHATEHFHFVLAEVIEKHRRQLMVRVSGNPGSNQRPGFKGEG